MYDHSQPFAYISGVSIGVTAALNRRERNDVAVFALAEGTQVAAVFTRNKACAAPVSVARHHLASGQIRALVVNSGNANAGLGAQGHKDCMAVCEAVASRLGLDATSVLPFSTGVIGERLPAEQICAHLPEAVDRLDENGWDKAAKAIMTTDTYAKIASRTITMSGTEVSITGIAKGAGMIRPDMATMLAFIATDAGLPSEAAQAKLAQAVDQSFNRITVDGDTSTNDACVLMATAKSGINVLDSSGPQDQEQFDSALLDVASELAQHVVRDAEGATKFVTVEVTGGWSMADCLKAAHAVAGSPLVKTALFASDPNWGRIYAAVGRSMIDDLEMSHVNISINGVEVLTAGALNPRYSEAKGLEAMSASDIAIHIDLGMGNRSATVWTSDLSHDYVRINAEYRS